MYTTVVLPDDGGAAHLKRGMRLPDIDLPTTAGGTVSLAKIKGMAVVYVYPWTGRPGLPDPPGWDDIPGAHGSTPQSGGFRNLYAGFRQVDTEVFGLSAQSTDYQREFADRMDLPFALISDEAFALQGALSLPTFETGGVTYLKRLTIAVENGRINRVYYPIAHPAAHAREVCAWLGMIDRSDLRPGGRV